MTWTWEQLQEDHREWVRRVYPDQPSIVPAAGILEEAGELLHAVLKLHQHQLWPDSRRYDPDSLMEALVDAFGDIVIYTTSLLNATDRFLAPVMHKAFQREYRGSGEPINAAAAIVRAASEIVLSPLREENIVHCMSLVRALANQLDVDLVDAVHATWGEVRRRGR